MIDEIKMVGVREYNEELPIYLENDDDNKRIIIRAYNECWYNNVAIDLVDLIDWIKKNKPELI